MLLLTFTNITARSVDSAPDLAPIHKTKTCYTVLLRASGHAMVSQHKRRELLFLASFNGFNLLQPANLPPTSGH